MGLRATAETDLSGILENENDFGWPIRITNPAGAFQDLIGFGNDIAQLIDPDTGVAISGRQASVALRMSSLDALPVAIANSTSKPWLVTFDSINGETQTFKVIESNPDRSLGLITCLLEVYATATN